MCVKPLYKGAQKPHFAWRLTVELIRRDDSNVRFSRQLTIILMGGKLGLQSALGKGAAFSLGLSLEVVANPIASIAAE